MKWIIVALSLTIAGCSPGRVEPVVHLPVVAYPLTPAILRDRNVIEGFSTLIARSGYGRLPRESAAFLVVGESNDFRIVHWPATNQFHAQRWVGAVPDGTVAVVHTHPAHLPDPSAHDIAEARRTGIPIFVLTPGSVVLVRDGQRMFAAKITG